MVALLVIVFGTLLRLGVPAVLLLLIGTWLHDSQGRAALG